MLRIVGRVRCLFGRHMRAKRHAKLVDGVYFSRCSYCGVKMRQRGNKDWVVERD